MSELVRYYSSDKKAVMFQEALEKTTHSQSEGEEFIPLKTGNYKD